MKDYKVYYSGKTATVQANSSLDARDKAVILFKVKSNKKYMISVVLSDNYNDICRSL